MKIKQRGAPVNTVSFEASIQIENSGGGGNRRKPTMVVVEESQQ